MDPIESQFPKVGWKVPWSHLVQPPHSISEDAQSYRREVTGPRSLLNFAIDSQEQNLVLLHYHKSSLTPLPILLSDCITSFIFLLLHRGRRSG